MNAATRLALFAAGLVIVFAASFGIARATVPADVVHDWKQNRVTEPAMTSPMH